MSASWSTSVATRVLILALVQSGCRRACECEGEPLDGWMCSEGALCLAQQACDEYYGVPPEEQVMSYFEVLGPPTFQDGWYYAFTTGDTEEGSHLGTSRGVVLDPLNGSVASYYISHISSIRELEE